MIKFNSSPKPTIGVEIELQLIDKNNFDLKNISSKVLASIDKKFSNNIKCELIESKSILTLIFSSSYQRLPLVQ